MTLLITELDVRELLAAPRAMADAIGAMERAIVAEGSASVHPRVHLDHPPGGGTERSGRSLRLLPAIVPDLGAAGVRVYTMNKEGDPARAAPAELILLFELGSMQLRAVIEDYSLHTLRTAAPTGVAARLLARADAHRVGVIGTGRHARGQLAAVASVRELREVRVHGRDQARLEWFCADVERELRVPVRPAATPQETVEDAALVILATSAGAPVLDGRWLAPGTHVTSIAPGELDETTVLRSRVVSPAPGELLRGQPEWPPFPALAARGALREEEISSLHDILTQAAPGRREADEVTLFVSTGVATWDVAIAIWAVEAAQRSELGSRLWAGALGRSTDGLVAPRTSPPLG